MDLFIVNQGVVKGFKADQSTTSKWQNKEAASLGQNLQSGFKKVAARYGEHTELLHVFQEHQSKKLEKDLRKRSKLSTLRSEAPDFVPQARTVNDLPAHCSLHQGVPNWGICTRRGTFRFCKGYIKLYFFSDVRFLVEKQDSVDVKTFFLVFSDFRGTRANP